jgi:peptide/nickel transport system substrate-binding protein
MMQQTDLQSSNQVQAVAKQQLERVGFKVDLAPMDWQTVVSRRARREAPAQGGWNLFFTTNITLDLDNPGTNAYAAGTCEKAWFGWPCDPEIEVLRAAFIRESDPIKQKEIGDAISDRLVDQGFYAPVGQYKAFGAYRKDRLSGWLAGPVPVLWNIAKKD